MRRLLKLSRRRLKSTGDLANYGLFDFEGGEHDVVGHRMWTCIRLIRDRMVVSLIYRTDRFARLTGLGINTKTFRCTGNSSRRQTDQNGAIIPSNRSVDPVRGTIVKHTLRMLEKLSVVPLCEGVETAQALNVLRDLDVSLIQG
jgi:hypothetical protein